MSAKVNQASAVESHRGQSTGTTSSSAASTSNPKISMFGAKSGFVIPKNKLSGSLVPVFRGAKKLGGSDAANEESTKQVQRKTKWGLDLTQDTAVRRGRALAYQTRVDQITQQLKLGILELGDNQDPSLATRDSDQQSNNNQSNNEKSELLELERREAIGEILKLNPSYKAPPDYIPFLKEARVPIPFKEYPGYNFLALIFALGSDTQKRVEKETGAKIQVYGTKSGTGEKGEITSPDEKEIHSAYEELYVLISADTYEKVDAAVSLIELLVTPVSGKPAPVSTPSTSVPLNDVHVSQSQDTTSPNYTVPTTQGVGQLVIGSTQPALQGQFRYPSPWLQAGPLRTPMRPPFGFNPPPNPSPPILNNPPPSSYNPSSNMPSLFGPRPGQPFAFGSVPQNSPRLPSSPQQQRPYMPQPNPYGHTGYPRNPPMQAPQPNMSAQLPFQGQPPPTGPPPTARPTGPLTPDRPLNPGWSGSPQVSIPPQGPRPQPIAGPHVQPAPTRPPVNSSSSVIPMQQVLTRAPTPNLSTPLPASTAPPPPPLQMGIPRPQQPSSGDFTFQPHRPSQHAPPPNVMTQPPRPPSFRFPPGHNSNPQQPVMQGYPRPNQMGQPQPQGQMRPTIPNAGQMGPRNFSPASQMLNLTGSLPPPPRLGNPVQYQQNYLPPPPRTSAPNQHLNNNLPGTVQNYDPFSPTSVAQQQGGNAVKVRRQENDSEYEDLMASVGVK